MTGVWPRTLPVSPTDVTGQVGIRMNPGNQLKTSFEGTGSVLIPAVVMGTNPELYILYTPWNQGPLLWSTGPLTPVAGLGGSKHFLDIANGYFDGAPLVVPAPGQSLGLLTLSSPSSGYLEVDRVC